MYFEWKKLAYSPMKGGEHVPVVVIGAGPIGLAMAQSLARQGIPSVVLEKRDQVSDGSRAIALTRRTMQIFDAIGVGDDVLARAMTWDLNEVYFGNDLIYDMRLRQPEGEKHRMTNLQQCWVEQILLDRLSSGGLADVRWQCEVVRLGPRADGVEIEVQGPDGSRSLLTAGYVVAADGARGSTRKLVGLRYEGARFEQRFVITDFHMVSGTEIGRRVWFSPPYARGTTVLQHRAPYDVWRLDYQLRPDDDAEAEMQPERVRQRVAAHLEMIGETQPYEIIWTSIYRASALSLPTYNTGRVLFIGDAAHQIPIFGGRGVNNGFMDVMNLSWKLGHVLKGWAPAALLDTYTQERRGAILETIEDLTKVTLYMTTPTSGEALMRDAVLSLSLTEPFVHTLFDPFRVPPYGALNISAVESTWAAELEFDEGPAMGQAAPDAQIATPGPGPGMRLFDGMGGAFALLAWGGTPEADGAISRLFDDLNQARLPLKCLEMTGTAGFGARPGTAYLLRPDQHVAARWRNPVSRDVLAAIRHAMGHFDAPVEAMH